MKNHSRILIEVIRNMGIVPVLGCEVGVWKGGNSAALFEAFPHLRLMMVDKYRVLTEAESKSDIRLAKKSQDQMNQAMQSALQNTDAFHERRIQIISDSHLASCLVIPESLDFVFIDANHTYESVKQDLSSWYWKVRKGGLFAGHDYCSSGRKKGVKKAVDEFADELGYEVQSKDIVWWFKKHD